MSAAFSAVLKSSESNSLVAASARSSAPSAPSPEALRQRAWGEPGDKLLGDLGELGRRGLQVDGEDPLGEPAAESARLVQRLDGRPLGGGEHRADVVVAP